MTENWKTAVNALSNIHVQATSHNGPVTITGSLDGLRCIGVGTDAAVFRYIEAPEYAFKVYAEEKLAKKDMEQQVYQQLGSSPYFSTFHGTGDRFLVLNFEQGVTLYDCLLQGIHIPKQVIEDVEKARDYVRERGLNPRDIHLKNILLQDGRAKMLDVSEYLISGNDFRWEHLKRGYEEYYHFIDGKPIPFWLIDTTKKWYNQMNNQYFVFEEFMKKVTRLTMFWRG